MPIDDLNNQNNNHNIKSELNVETENYFQEYVNGFSEEFNIKDPFSSTKKFEDLLNATKNTETPIIFDGEVYDGITFGVKENTFYLIPKDYSGNKYFEIIEREDVDPFELMDTGDELRNAILKIAYDNWGPIEEQKIRELLESKKTSNEIESFEYDFLFDEVTITYSGEKTPWVIKPLEQSESTRFVVESTKNPEDFVQNILREFESMILQGNVLIINSEQQTHYFIPKDLLENELEILSNNSLTNQEKIAIIAGNTTINSTINYNETNNFKDAKNKNNALFSEEPIATVPKTKKIYFFQSTNRPSKPHTDLEINLLRAQNGPLSPFYENGYKFEIIKKSPDVGDSIIPEFYSLMSDETKDVLFLTFHGGKNSLQSEFYYVLLPESKIDASLGITLEEFNQRKNFLLEKYGQEKIKTFLIDWELGLEALDDSFSWFKKIRTMMNNKIKIGGFSIEDTFFESNNFPEKTLVFLFACHGGSLADNINSKVILAAKPENVTTLNLFFEDLKKISPYLLKNPIVRDVKLDETSMRNYLILDSFIQGQFNTFDLTGKTMLVKETSKLTNACNPKKDTLCSIQLYSKEGETVSIAPHVKKATGEEIIFNAHMATGKKAEEIVTISFDEECSIPEDIDELKPEWVSNNKMILHWLNKAYTNWEENYDGPYALITIHNDKAISQDSEVELTGNNDCGCNINGCSQRDCVKEPAKIEYNANKPKTDFTFVMPCVREVYYESCVEDNVLVKISKDKFENKIPETIVVDGVCHKQSNYSVNAKPISSWENGDNCIDICNPVEDEIMVEDCMNPIVEVRNNPIDEMDNWAVYINGVKVTKGIQEVGEGEYSTGFSKNVAAFNGHYAYVLDGPYCEVNGSYSLCSLSDIKLIYDDKVIYQTPTFEWPTNKLIGVDSLFSNKSIGWVVTSLYGVPSENIDKIYNGKNIGDLGNCILTKDSFVCVEGTGEAPNVYYNEQKIGQTINSHIDDSTLRREILLPTLNDIAVSKNNILFRSEDGNLNFFKSGNKISEIDSLIDPLNENISYYDVFGEHIAYEDYLEVYYDGVSLGQGNTFCIFGDSIAFVTEYNPKTGEGRRVVCNYESKDVCEKDSKCVWDNTYSYCSEKIEDVCGDNYTNATQCNANSVCQWIPEYNYCAFVGNSFNNSDECYLILSENECNQNDLCFWENECTNVNPVWIYFNGVYYDVIEKLGLEKSSRVEYYDIDNIKIFDNHLAFTIELDGSIHLIYDWKDKGVLSNAVTSEKFILFKDHLIFEDISGKIIYDGKDLGYGIYPMIYDDHYLFFEDTTYGPFIYDGKRYGGSTVITTSIPDSMVQCYRHYLDSVPTKPFGEVVFD